MRIPKNFKIGILTFNVKLVEKIEVTQNQEVFLSEKKISVKHKKINSDSMLFGLCDPTAQTIWLATKDLQGNDMSKERLVSTFYHELAHALVGETANNDANCDEVFIEALGKNLYAFVCSESKEEAELEKE